jgi:hypothetical protein
MPVDIPVSLTEFGSLGAVLVVVWFFLKHIKEQSEANRDVMSKVTTAFDRNTEALARTERALDATERVLKEHLEKETR